MKKEDDSMRVLATGTCDTLSGSSKLTYHIGSTPDGEIHLRVHGNTGGGFFSKEWVPMDRVLALVDEIPVGHPVTALDLFPLFRNRSVNTPGYLLAVLIKEGLLSPIADKKRQKL